MKSRIDERVVLKDGAGGRAMRRLIEKVLAVGYDEPDGFGLAAMDDGAALRVGDRWLIFTTDAHVVKPVFFPGGDIGRIAVCGTVNDLAMMGATRPLGLSCAVVIEEGFAHADLVRIQASMREACREAGTTVVTGDTKVMGRGEVDGIVITTSGVAMAERVVTDRGCAPGDVIIVSGTMGDHGLAIMAARGGLAIDATLVSDVAPTNGLVRTALAAGGEDLVAMKDPTRGGLASSLHEMASKSGTAIVVEERAVPITDDVRALGEILGIDPLHVANEGKVVLAVKRRAAEFVLQALRAHPLGKNATIVGECIEAPAGRVILETGFGRRILAEPEGEPLPRIC